jgi:hypothetical protein
MINALPRVKTELALDNLVLFILRSQGGGDLKVPIPGANQPIDLHADSEGGSIYGSTGATPENPRQASGACRDALKERYPDLR